MKIIKDPQRQINLHPLVIYFVLSTKETKEKEAALMMLNNYRGFTRGIFKFETVTRVGSYCNDITSEIADSIKHYNMFVRLVDDNSDEFHYAVHKINYNQRSDDIEISMQNFIVEVCKKNIKHLATRISDYEGRDVSAEKKTFVRQMQQAFMDAVSMRDFTHGVWARLMGEECLEIPRHESKISTDGNAKEMPAEFAYKFEKAAKANNPQYLWNWLESLTGAPDKETSDEIAKGCYDSKYTYVRRDHQRRMQPKEKPNVSVEIKHVVKRVLKDGREKKEYGVVFTVNDEVFPICFGSKDQTMLYVCTLLRKKIGEKMYLHEFYNNSKGTSRNTKFKRGKSVKWLRAVYDSIFPHDAREFSEWIQKVEEAHGRPLNQGKSQSTKVVEEAMKSQSSGIYYCTIKTKEDEIGDSYYDIKIEPDKITIPENMQFLLDEFYEMMNITA